jgi:7-cyano-7-deazaguanine synthase in queuosine biosynthesis
MRSEMQATTIHTEHCYSDGCGGIVSFRDHAGTCPRCGLRQRIVLVKGNVASITERRDGRENNNRMD